MKRTIMGMIAIAIIASIARPPTARAFESSAAPGGAQKQVTSGEITLRGTVEAVDQSARTISVRGEKGNVVTIDIPATGTSIDKLQPGDVVSVRYHDRVSVRRKPAGEPAVDRTDPPVSAEAAQAPGMLPAATVVSQRVTTVTITGWDPSTRVVAFTGPTGVAYTRQVLDTVDPALIAGLKIGDRADVTRTEAVNLSVESRQTVSVDATESFRNRFTMSVLWGWDNQFSGDVITASSGQTTTGAPIQLNDVSYDDLYGRMGFFKIGAAYRTTPRSEAVINFVLSRSSSDTFNIGTIGAAGTPINVKFDDYDYWGFEGGQRWFFTRVRFTPYVGYLAGFQRYDDITATFVDAPPDSMPGLAAQDGKFFEKSWALSLGPTAGVLVGLGPFELMLETQIRYMNGLSDVDWLVEEGLRDINSESSRWSFPVQLGARIRF
jgi:hypothetical protein